MMGRYIEYYDTLVEMFERGQMTFKELLEDDEEELFKSDTIQKHLVYGNRQEKVAVNLMEEMETTETVRLRLYLDGLLNDDETYTVNKQLQK